MAPWTQFYDMGGSTEKPYAMVRNISFSNINVQCKSLGTMEGNPRDSVTNIVFSNVTATAGTPTLKTGYRGIQFNNVTVNGAKFYLPGKQ